MNIIKDKTILAILVCIILAFLCIPGGMSTTSYAADDSTETGDAVGDEAFAVFDSADGSLKLFRDEAGTYSNGQVVGTRTYYTGIETATGLAEPKWKDMAGSISSFSIEDGDVIKPGTLSLWFNNCTLLTDVDVTGLDTSAVTSMYYMFAECSAIQNLDLSGFDTVNVSDMYRMFYNCSSLESLDISGFNCATLPDQSKMFTGCTSLKLIRIPSGYKFISTCGISEPIQRIESEDGELTSEPLYYKVADYSGESPGLYRIGGKTMAVFDSDDGSLIFTEDDRSEHLAKREVIGSKTYYTGILNTKSVQPEWKEYSGSVKTIDFQRTVSPLSCNSWFFNFSNLEVCDIQKLDTSNTQQMSNMFGGCRNIYRIALGEKSIITTILPYSGWRRYKMPDGNETDGPELTNLRDYDGTAPGWYRKNGSDICAAFDSSDGSLTFFKDDTGEIYNGQTMGTKTYYLNFTASDNVPWEEKKSQIRTVTAEDVIEPNTIKNWFGGCINLTAADLSNLRIPSMQRDAMKGCVSLRKLVIGHNDSGIYLQNTSMLSGIWRNKVTGEECRLITDGGYNNDTMTEGEWKLVTDVTVTLNIDSSALEHLGISDVKEIKVFHTKNGQDIEGDAIYTVGSDEKVFNFTDGESIFTSDQGNIEYYDYCFTSTDGKLSVIWEKAETEHESSVSYDLYLRDCRYSLISGTVKWEGDRSEDRPESVTVSLWRNGVRYEEQEVGEDSGWKYSFTVPTADDNGVVCKYEVKEDPLDEYEISREGYDGMRLMIEKTDETIPFLIFRRGGRWYMADIEFRGGVLTVPGDAFYLPMPASGVNVLSSDKTRLNKKNKRTADSWLSVPFNTETTADISLFESDPPEDLDIVSITPLTDSPSEMSDILKTNMGSGNVPNLYTITEPYPMIISGNNFQALCGTLGASSITNISLNGSTVIKGKKIWDEHPHPDEITVILKQNGEEISSKKTSGDTGWTYSFNGLPIFDDEGRKYDYTVTEKPIKGYYMTRESKPAENLDKAVRISYTVNRGATDIDMKDAYFVAYDREGRAYKYKPESADQNGEHTIIFPTLDFDLVFTGDYVVVRGIRGGTAGYPVIVTDLEIIDSPYIYSPGTSFTDNADQSISWNACDLSEETPPYPDRSGLYHYEEDENAALAFVYADCLNVIPYTIELGDPWQNIINHYKEGSLTIKKTGENGEPLKDAEFELYFTENDSDDDWEKSESSPTARGITDERGELILENVPYGRYLLIETKAPSGYKIGEPGKITIDSEETVYNCRNERSKTVIRKVNEKNQLIGGAVLKLLDSGGRELYSWTTADGAVHEIQGLTEGAEYILREITPPEGYEKADDIIFEVQEGTDTEITMEDRKIKEIIPIPTGVKVTGLLLAAALVAVGVFILKRN